VSGVNVNYFFGDLNKVADSGPLSL